MVHIALNLGQISQVLTITFEDQHSHMMTINSACHPNGGAGTSPVGGGNVYVWTSIWAAMFKCLLTTVLMERSAQLHRKFLSKLLSEEYGKNQKETSEKTEACWSEHEWIRLKYGRRREYGLDVEQHNLHSWHSNFVGLAYWRTRQPPFK